MGYAKMMIGKDANHVRTALFAGCIIVECLDFLLIDLWLRFDDLDGGNIAVVAVIMAAENCMSFQVQRFEPRNRIIAIWVDHQRPLVRNDLETRVAVPDDSHLDPLSADGFFGASARLIDPAFGLIMCRFAFSIT